MNGLERKATLGVTHKMDENKGYEMSLIKDSYSPKDVKHIAEFAYRRGLKQLPLIVELLEDEEVK